MLNLQGFARFKKQRFTVKKQRFTVKSILKNRDLQSNKKQRFTVKKHKLYIETDVLL